MHISTIIILGRVTDRVKNYYFHQRASYVRVFDWHIYISLRPILKFKVKVITTSTVLGNGDR